MEGGREAIEGGREHPQQAEVGEFKSQFSSSPLTL